MTLELPKTPLCFADDPAFIDDLPYGPEVLLVDQLLEIDAEKDLIKCRMPTDVPMPFTSAQRAHAVRHPQHVAGAVMVHATGMMGFVHAYYLLGLRHANGWIGYGTHIHRVVFRKLVQPGAPIDATCVITKKRLGRSRHVLRYSFEFRHEGDVCYEGDQSAVWMNTAAIGVATAAAGAEAE
jgi:hypothetical protein